MARRSDRLDRTGPVRPGGWCCPKRRPCRSSLGANFGATAWSDGHAGPMAPIARLRRSESCRDLAGGEPPVSGASVPPCVGTARETADHKRAERVGWLRHAVAFVGPRAGLSRMAGAVGTPVVLIGGCTDPTDEPATSYPVIDRPVCNSWRNAVRPRVDRPDAPWCAPWWHVASVRRHKAEHRRIGDRNLETGPGDDRTGRARPAHANACPHP
jgi:hypothetical protein